MKKICCLITAAVLIFTFPCSCGAVNKKPEVSAKAAVVIEAGTGRTVFGKNENTRLPMASTTKIMSVLLTLESGDLDSEFVIDSEAVRTEGSSMGLVEGDIVSKRDLCAGMLLPSGNDAANCAAVKVGGSMAGFADMMNARASQLGMRNTHFVTPSGLHDDDHYSTAYDMAQLASYAIKNEDFRAICSQKSIKLSFGNPPYERWLANTNKLLARYEGCIGVKTGFTDEAGRCLVSAAERDGVTLICVTLNAPDDWNDHEKMLDYGFSRVKCVPLEADDYYSACLVGGVKDELRLIPERTPMCPVINGETPRITWKLTVPQMIYAPVEKGRRIGELVLADGSREIDRIPLIAAEDAAVKTGEPHKKSFSELITDKIKELLF